MPSHHKKGALNIINATMHMSKHNTLANTRMSNLLLGSHTYASGFAFMDMILCAKQTFFLTFAINMNNLNQTDARRQSWSTGVTHLTI